MKKILKIIFITVFCIIMTLITASAQKDTKVQVNGNYIKMDQNPIFQSDRILIPLRAVGEALNCKVSWDGETQTATLNNGAAELKVTIGEYVLEKINISSEPITLKIPLDAPAFIEGGRTMVPLRAVAEALFLDVKWDEAERDVVIKSKYEKIGIEKSGYIKVDIGDKTGFIDLEGKVIIPIEYENDGAYGYVQGNGTYAIVKKNGKYGAVDMNNKVIVNCTYTLEDSGTLLREKAVSALKRKGIKIPETDKYGRKE